MLPGLRSIPILVLACAFAAAPARAAVPGVEISLQVDGKKYAAGGRGECKFAPQASIYGIEAALYSVSHRADRQSLRLSLWQPKDGRPAMLTLTVSTGADRYQVDTVQGGSKRGGTKGTGKASVQKSGEGGVITVDAVAESGERIRGTLRCSRFGGLQAEGG